MAPSESHACRQPRRDTSPTQGKDSAAGSSCHSNSRIQIERKQMLSDLLGEDDVDLPIIYSEHQIGDGQEMFEAEL
jgi:hypothetical protein